MSGALLFAFSFTSPCALAVVKGRKRGCNLFDCGGIYIVKESIEGILAMKSDSTIIQNVKQGDRNSFSILVDRYQRLVYAVAWSRVGDPDLAEDISQDAFLRAFQYLATLRNPERFPAWITHITRNLANAAIRRQSRERDRIQRWNLETATSHTADSACESDPELKETLRNAISRLSSNHRECLVLFYLQGHDQATCADKLGIREGTFRTRLHRARTALRSELEETLARDLAHLGPAENLKSRVMSILPAGPFFAQAVKVPLVAPLVWMMQLLPAAALYGELSWFQRQQKKNYRKGAEHRGQIMRGSLLRLVIVLVPVILISGWITRNWGSDALFAILCILMLPGLYPAARMLRYNQSLFAWASIIQILIMATCFGLIGFLGYPLWLFFAGMLIINMMLYGARKTMPMRNDYNLFFRAASGELQESLPDNKWETETEAGQPRQADSFLSLLGNAFLIVDARKADGGVIAYLPPVRPSTSYMLYPLAGRRNSQLRLQSNGICSATLSQPDQRALHEILELHELDRASLEQRVARSVQAAWDLAAHGKSEAGLSILQPVSDEELFSQPPHNLKSAKIVFILSIIAAALAGIAVFFSQYAGNW
jgi:RNA polymerase sigma-70 factor (ECF subfamily)